MRTFLPVIAAVFLSALPADAFQADNGSWATTNPTFMTIGRTAHVAAEAGGNIYVYGGTWYAAVGGSTLAQASHTISRYSPVTNSWSEMTGIPAPSTVAWRGWSNTCGASFDGNVYQFAGNLRGPAGTTGIGLPTTHAWRYNVASNSWTALASLPVALAGCRAAATSSRIYITGGWNDTDYSVATLEYDPATDSWATKADMPEYVYSHFTGAIGGKVYITGGFAYDESWGELACRRTREYDPATDEWTSKADLPASESGHVGTAGGAFAVAYDKLYVMGGTQYYVYYGNQISLGTNRNLEYSPAADAWIVRPAMSGMYNNQAGVSCVRNGSMRVFVTGGGSTRYSVFEFTPPLPPNPPANVGMKIPGGADLVEGDYLGGASIQFFADLSDPNVDNVCLDVEVRPAGQAFTGTPTVSSTMGAEGYHAVTFTGLTEGPWRWKYRTRDAGNTVTAWTEFGTSADDFIVDQSAPVPVTGIAPGQGASVRVTNRGGGMIQFAWTGSTDNSPGLAYIIEVHATPDFANLITSQTLTETFTEVGLSPNLNASFYYWRVRSIDIAGNQSAWSGVMQFDVYFDDGINHAEGDAAKFCGMSAGTGSLPGLLLAVALLGFRRRR